MDTKKCMVCGEEIRAAALKCRFCNSMQFELAWKDTVIEWRGLAPADLAARWSQLDDGQKRMFVAVESALASVPSGRFDFREGKDGELVRLDRESGTADLVSNVLWAAKPLEAPPVRSAQPSAAPAVGQTGRPAATNVLVVKLLGKRLSGGDADDYLILDLEFTARSLARPARAIKGALLLQDLFGETKLSVGWTLEKPPMPGQTVPEYGSGFSYNQFMSNHNWVLATSIDDIKVEFRVDSVIYKDGERQDF